MIISVYSIYQYIWGYPHTIECAKKINSSLLNPPHNIYAKNILINKRAIGTFPSPNILGGYLLMAFFLSLAILKNQVSHKRWFFAPPLIIIALMLTKSLGVWISFIAIFIILFFIPYNALKKHKVLLIISFACIAITMPFIILGRWDRITDLGNHHNSITMRFNYWKTAMAIIKDHPFIGIGPGNFQQMFLNYYELGWGTGTKYAHNIFLQLWLETGILGFISIFYLIIAFITKNALKSSYVFLAALIFFLHNLIDIIYFIPEAGLIWWAIMGLVF
ncbi:MAG: hypothetical protein A2047_00370 [Omnitrophica bacterium GWA2_41_15]|nr:MAG: hypothetical protein A2047_00370 [Omnitrophica bacterium GWA2_41_15]